MKKNRVLHFVLIIGLAAIISAGCKNRAAGPENQDQKHSEITIVCPTGSSALVDLSAREIRRYIYLRTSTLLPIAGSAGGNTISFRIDPSLDEQEYRLKSDGESLEISGGSDVAVLYGTYGFAEKLGVRFQIDGDIIPDLKIPFSLPVLDEKHQPLFRLRGILPFHDFPEGPDWWTTDDWKAFSGQLAKMRMNFIGTHTYPFRNKDLGPEPAVWIGLPEDVNPDGTVKVADISSWYTTAKFMPYGCYAPGKTGAFSYGASQVFPADDYGPEVNLPDDFPFPKSPGANVEMVNRTGRMLNEVFTDARELGIKTAVGTESPLDIPDAIIARLKSLGLDPDDPATHQKLYEGTFLRIKRAYPVDYYWIWGHEGEIDEGRFVANLNNARQAIQATNAPFSLGICGWGWTAGHFPTLDQALPKDVFFSAISHNVGNTPVSPNFSGLDGRVKFAIPWAEDDPNLTGIQFLAGRMRRDALDALAYGCDGLFCLHWRTRVIGPNISSLAQAGWEIGEWGLPYPDNKSRDSIPRNLDPGDFYDDWALAQFGPEVAGEISAIFRKLDGNFPRPGTWNLGPGVININRKPWQEVRDQYAFAGEMEVLRPKVRGSGNLARFDWWNHEFRFMEKMAELACARGELDLVMEKIAKTSSPDSQRDEAISEAIRIRLEMTNILESMFQHMIATLNNASELGTIANIELQSLLRCKLLTGHDETLAELTGSPLPPDAFPRKEYQGTPLLVNLTVRTSVKQGESLNLNIIALDQVPVKYVRIKYRQLGTGRWKTIDASHNARAVWRAVIPNIDGDLEYWIVSKTANGKKLTWPASAPEINQTVVIRMGMGAFTDPASGQILLTENGKKILQYNYKTVFEKDALDTLAANKYTATPNDTFMTNPSIYAVPRSNYIHPVYGLGGEMLTRDWSKDHPHHRGIYWAWPEVEYGKKRGDLHALQIVFARPTGKIQLQSNPDFAQVEAENLWLWQDQDPIVREVALIRAYPATGQGRLVDLAFRFIALKDSVTLARRETTLYGGLNIRMQTPHNQIISTHTDSSGLLPRRAWSDLSGLFRGAQSTSGMTVFQHKQNPDYPGEWIQYPDLSWCQPTFPEAGTRYLLIPGKPLILRYRIFIHDGDQPDDNRASLLWDAFNADQTTLPDFSFPEK